jgi:sulfur relay (sulfurtransferase) complex TusBCD TusD component (DsrE family)
LRFYGYPKGLWPYLRSANLMARFIREIRRGTKARDHKFPSEEAVYKLPWSRRGKKGGGRRGGSRGSRRRGRRWRRCFRSGMPPVHKRLHIHLDTTERLARVAREKGILLMMCDSCALERGLATGEPRWCTPGGEGRKEPGDCRVPPHVVEGAEVGCLPDLYAALAGKVDQVITL